MDKIVTGFILKISSYKDSDAIITLLSKDGELVVFNARGLLKSTSKNASACQLYSYGEFTLSTIKETNNYVLKNALNISMIKKIYQDIRISILFAFMAESILRIEDYDYLLAFHFFEIVYQHLETKNHFLTILLIILKYNMIYTGIMLEASSCVNCGTKKKIVTVSYENGGFLCEQCSQALNLGSKESDYLKQFRYILLATIDNINQFEVNERIGAVLFYEFQSFMESHSGIHFKSLELVPDIIKNTL